MEDCESFRWLVKKSVSSSYAARSGELEEEEAEVDVPDSCSSDLETRAIVLTICICSGLNVSKGNKGLRK